MNFLRGRVVGKSQFKCLYFKVNTVPRECLPCCILGVATLTEGLIADFKYNDLLMTSIRNF